MKQLLIELAIIIAWVVIFLSLFAMASASILMPFVVIWWVITHA